MKITDNWVCTKYISQSRGWKKNLEYQLKVLASLVSKIMSTDMLSYFDFFMIDRAEDMKKCLKLMGVSSEQILHCSAHISLGIDNSFDKIVRSFETSIRVDKLVKLTDGQAIFTNSVFSLAILQTALHHILSYHTASTFNTNSGGLTMGCVMRASWVSLTTYLAG